MNEGCPFCGENMIHFALDLNQGNKYGYVECLNCGAKGPDVRTNFKNTEKEPWHPTALREWNGRKLEKGEIK